MDEVTNLVCLEPTASPTQSLWDAESIRRQHQIFLCVTAAGFHKKLRETGKTLFSFHSVLSVIEMEN